MFQVYAVYKDGSRKKIGRPLKTEALAHDFCKDCFAILDNEQIATFEYEKTQDGGE